MAEEFGVVIVEKVVEKLIDPIIRQFSYMFFYKSNIKNLTKGVEDLRKQKSDVTLSMDAHNRNLEIIGQSVMSWLDEVEENGKKAHEILEDTKIVESGCWNGWCPSLKQRYVVSRKAVKQLVVVKELQTNGEKYTQTAYPALPTGTMTSASTLPPEVFESRISLTKKVIEALKNENLMIIGVCGLGGVGKTTMAKEIRDKAIAEDICDEVAMAVVTENPDLKKVQSELASMLGLKLEEDTIADVRGKKLYERLMKGKRTLIILDDVWKTLNLGELGVLVGDQLKSKGCKVLITSRDEHVCNAIGTKINFAVKLLSSTEAWDLFKEKAEVLEETGELYPIARKVSEECGGLPLAIVVVGTALKGKEKDEWQDALEQLEMSNAAFIPGMENEVYKRLRLSYTLLENDQLRRLFLECCFYPEDFDIPIEELVRYSIGLRLFKDASRVEIVRRRVKSLVNQLKSCYLLLDSDKPGHVKVHDVLRDFGLKEPSQGEYLCLVGDNEKLEQCLQNDLPERLTEISISSSKEIVLPPGLLCPLLQRLTLSAKEGSVQMSANNFGGMKELSFVSLRGQSISINSEEIFLESPSKPLEYFMNVRTLCLEYCRVDTDIRIIGSMKRLEILSFICSDRINILPSELGQLVNLKVLDLRHSEVNLILPGVLSSFKKLEDLYMGRYFRQSGVETLNRGNCASIIELNSLSALKTLQVSVSDSEVSSKLKDFFFDKLILFDIEFVWHSNSYCSLYDLPNRMVINNFDMTHFTREKMGALFRNSKVLSLDCVWGLENVIEESDEVAFTNLKELTLIDTDDLVQIFHGSLPAGLTAGMLEEVKLEKLGAMKNLWSAQVHPSSFENLKIFKMESCNAIKSLFSQSVASCLVQLETLEIFSCKMLENIVFEDETEDDGNAKMAEFPKLRNEALRRLPSIKNLWSTQVRPSSFENLKIFKMESCNAIQSIFSRSVARCLVQLETLKISSCEMLENIFFEDETEDDGNPKMTEFPKLRNVILSRLPSLKNFLTVSNSSESIQRMSFPSMEKLEFDGVNASMIVVNEVKPGSTSHQLRFLGLRCCRKLSCISSTFDETKPLQKLVELCITGCSLMKTVFDLKGNGLSVQHNSEEVIFGELESIELYSLDELRHICMNFPKQGLIQRSSFCKLKVLEVGQCSKLKYILSPMVAKLLVNLQEIHIRYCTSLEQVILFEEEEDGYEIEKKMIEFPKLRKVELAKVPSMKNFVTYSNGSKQTHIESLFTMMISFIA